MHLYAWDEHQILMLPPLSCKPLILNLNRAPVCKQHAALLGRRLCVRRALAAARARAQRLRYSARLCCHEKKDVAEAERP